MSGSPVTVVVPFPQPERVTCPRCWGSEDAAAVSRGLFSDAAHLAKHQKACHPGDNITYECSVCAYRGVTAYPLKNVRAHYEREHSGTREAAAAAPRRRTTRATTTAAAAATSTAVAPPTTGAQRAASTAPSASGSRAGTTGVRARAARAAPGPASGAVPRATPATRGKTRATTTATITATTTRTTTTTTRGRAPSTATTLKVHTPPHALSTPSPSAYLSLPSSSDEGTITRRSPSYAAVTRAPAGTRTTSPGTARTTAGAHGAAILRSATRRSDSSGSDDGAAGSRGATAGSISRVGRLRDYFESPPDERPVTCAPSPADYRPRGGARADGAPAARLTDHPLPTGRFPSTPPGALAAARILRSSPEQSEARAFTGVPAVLPVHVPACGAGAPLSSIWGTPPTTRGVPQPGPAAFTPPVFTPVSSSPAALTTSTVVTTTAGGPIMSTGAPSAGGRHTPPVAPCTPTRPRSPPTAGPSMTGGMTLRPRQGCGVALPPTSPSGDEEEGDKDVDNDGDGDRPWTVAASRGRRRRTARRRRTGVAGGSSSGSGTAGAESPVRPRPPPFTLADCPPLPPAGAMGYQARTAGGGTPPARIEEAAPGVSAGDRNVVHPSASRIVRGVMGRRGASASVLARPERTGAIAAPVSGAGGAARPPRAPRDPAVGAGRRPVPPAAAADAERRPAARRAAERRRLVALAESVATLDDLESLATQVSGFFGGSERGGGVARPRDRPARSREASDGGAGAARGGCHAGGAAPAEPPMFQGEPGGGRVGEATRIQALFRRNRRKAVREVLAGPTDVCRVPTRLVQRHFERLYRGGEGLRGVAPAEPPNARAEGQGGAAALVRPFAEREVDRRLRRTNNSAPGPDGVTYRDLRVADAGARLLTALYNACLRLEAVPARWKTSNTVLVYKKGDRESLDNWRPLALGDTIPKLFAAVLADRLTDWTISYRKLSPAQKGFLRDEGCYEHNFVLQEILTDVRRSRREAVVAWLDLSNAFGSVPHETIRRALVRAGVPWGLISIWGSMYDGCTTRVRTADAWTAPIHIRAGVRQGCPLSPIVFDLAIDSVLRAATAVGGGIELAGSRWSILAYADDLALIARSPAEMERLLAVVETEASSVGLRFNPAKCATLHIGAGAAGRVQPTTFEIQGQPVRPLAEGEAYEHLGIPTGFSVVQTPHAAMVALGADLRAVDRSLLAPWQKSEAVAMFLLPRLDFLLRGANVEKRPLKALDLQIRRLCKAWMHLPQRASAELVYLPPSRGGCGLLPLSDLADVLTIAHVFRLLTADDRAVRDLAWESLRGVVHRRIGHPPSCDEVAAFLSGSLEGRLRGGGEASLWSRARNAARRQSARCAIRWRWLEELGELVLECRGTRGRITKIPPGARAQVIGRLRSAVAEWYNYTLISKPDQGKVFEVSSRDRVSNHFVRGGSFTRFADWRFVHRARLDVLPLNGARRWGDGDKRCRRCGDAAETLPHVIGHCGPHSAAVQWRHDTILLRLKRACRLPGEVTVNQRVRGLDGELGALRPDLVVWHEPSKSVVICDVTVPFENRRAAFEEARARKLAKYSPMAEALRLNGYRVVVTAFVVGALGSWDPANEPVLKLLRVSKSYATMMRRLMVSDTIRWSRDIYVEHVSGVRQYEAPPRRVDGGCPDVPPPRAVRRRVTGPRADDGEASIGQANVSVNVA